MEIANKVIHIFCHIIKVGPLLLDLEHRRSGSCSPGSRWGGGRVYILPKILILGPNFFDLISGPNLKIFFFIAFLHFWTFQAISRFFFRGPVLKAWGPQKSHSGAWVYILSKILKKNNEATF